MQSRQGSFLQNTHNEPRTIARPHCDEKWGVLCEADVYQSRY